MTRRVTGLSLSGESLNVDYTVTGNSGSGSGRLVLTQHVESVALTTKEVRAVFDRQ